jgi:FlaA1/EpsC-like NDP-sugar epimerase
VRFTPQWTSPHRIAATRPESIAQTPKVIGKAHLLHSRISIKVQNNMSSSPTPSKILLFGATGVIGKFILEQLIDANPAFEKIGIFTSPGTAQNKGEDLAKLKEKGVEVVVGDVNSESDVKKAFEGVFTSVPLQHPTMHSHLALLDSGVQNLQMLT